MAGRALHWREQQCEVSEPGKSLVCSKPETESPWPGQENLWGQDQGADEIQKGIQVTRERVTSLDLANRRAGALGHSGQRGLLDICLGCVPGKTQGSPREGSGGAVVQAGYTPFPRKPGMKESCFLTILNGCKREAYRPGGREKARIHKTG